MKLVDGRPESTEGRLDKEIRVYDFLDSLGVKYQRVDHEAAMTMEACEEIDRTLSEGVDSGVAICKNLFLCNRQETDFYLLLIPGDKPFKTKYLSAQIGSSRLSFAKPEYMERYTEAGIFCLPPVHQHIESEVPDRRSRRKSDTCF